MAEPLKVYGWAGDQSGCGYYRIGLPMDAMRRAGHDTFASQRLFDTYERADVIVGQRIAEPGPSELWQALSRDGKKLVYEIDDDLFRLDPLNPSYAHFQQREPRQNMAKNMEAASMITVTTEPLAKVMRDFNDNVVVIPNYFPEELLTWNRGPRGHTIGWAGSNTHAKDLASVRFVLQDIYDEQPHSAFHFAGADYGRELFRAGRYRFTPFTKEVMAHYRNVLTFDIGLAPLIRSQFNNSKSAVKALEYAALGVPCIVSDEPPYRGWIEPGENGFLAYTADEWYDYLDLLLNDDEVWHHMSNKSREMAKEWTIEGNIHRWVDAFRSIL